MKNRCIMIFPDFDNMQVIDGLRNRYDRMVHRVRPHITLVFPFVSDIEDDVLHRHLAQALSGIRSFPLTLQGIRKLESPGGCYLFIGVQNGSDEVKKLHTALYDGILQPFLPEWKGEGGFIPHMTIGQFEDHDQMCRAYEEIASIVEVFHTVVTKITVESTDENERSVVELEFYLAAD